MLEFLNSRLFVGYLISILVVINIVVKALHTIFDVKFRTEYAKKQQEQAEQSRKEMEEFQKTMKMEDEMVEDVQESMKMKSLGKKSGIVRQKQAMEKDVAGSILDSDEVQVALAVAEEQFPALYEKWYPKIQENPQLAHSLVNIVQKYQGGTDQGIQLQTNGSGSSGSSSSMRY